MRSILIRFQVNKIRRNTIRNLNKISELLMKPENYWGINKGIKKIGADRKCCIVRHATPGQTAAGLRLQTKFIIITNYNDKIMYLGDN